MSAEETSPAFSWSQYWGTGNLHSFTEESGELFSEAFWNAFFARTDGPVSILDIGTGNGLIPLLAIRSLGPLVTVHGIDPARIQPESTGRHELSSVQFLSGVGAEKMPYDTASMDVVTSQFALEYSDVPASLQEICRVLAPRGRVGLVIHASDSYISTVSRAQLEQIGWLTQSGGFLDSAREMLRVLESRRTGSTGEGSHSAVRERYNALARTLIGKLEQAPEGDVLARAAIAAQQSLSGAVKGAGAGSVGFQKTIRMFEHEATRLREQLAAARSADQLRDIGSRLEAAGMEVALDTLDQRGRMMAYTVVATG